MTQHYLQDRSEQEVTWFQRRGFLQAAAAWTAMGGVTAAEAQSRSNIVELVGDILLNGQRLLPQQTIQTGDQITTGPGSTLIFALGNSAFHVRQNTSMSVERGASLTAVSLLRMISGAVISVWGKGSSRRIITPTLTAGIRGTGVYTEVWTKNRPRSYFCNCYGTVELNSATSRTLSEATYHQAYWSEVDNGYGAPTLSPARAINHTDEELENLARLIGQRTAWQISGKKGQKSYGNDY
jgi:hypothetical protein